MTRDTRDSEPNLIDGNVCAETFRRMQMPRQAEWCREIQSRMTALHAEYAELADRYDALAKRLHQYEPPAERFVPQSARPQPESSD